MIRFLDLMKAHWAAQPEKYNTWLDIMSDFRRGGFDTRGVKERLSKLYDGNTVLIEGFNHFLPPGYGIDCDQSEGFPVEQPNHTAIATPEDAVVISDG